ncbi:mCG147572 [Mus musculus]|nr:mCG147572 [Mus musculus]
MKNVLMEPGTKTALLKSSSILYPLVFYGCTIQEDQRSLPL